MNITGKLMGCALALVILAGIFAAGCTTQPSPTTTPTPTATAAPTATPVAHSPDTLLIATTTSLYDTGLLNAIQDYYENKTGIRLKITSQGTGIAIQVATRGDCDLLLVHSPSQEKAFIDKGLGTNQRCFAYNYFQIVGPENDPAGIRDMTPEAAFQTLYMLGVNSTPGISFASREIPAGGWANARPNSVRNRGEAPAWP
jgi:tungstate transport system substrate-binding protein